MTGVICPDYSPDIVSVKLDVTLEEARTRKGLTRTQVAAILGVSERTIYRYERTPGKRGVSPAVLRMLADIYEIELEDLAA